MVAGSLALADGTGANVAEYAVPNTTWSAVGDSSQLPGPVTAMTVNDGNSSSMFAAGRYVIRASSYCVAEQSPFAARQTALHHSSPSGMAILGLLLASVCRIMLSTSSNGLLDQARISKARLMSLNSQWCPCRILTLRTAS